MKHWKTATAALLAASLTGCFMLDAKSTKITEQNKDTYIDALADTRGLTVGETRDLIGYQMRTTMAAAFSHQSPPPIVGKTIGDLIKDQREWQASQNAKKDEEDKLAAEAKAKEDAVAAELRKAVIVSVYGKSYSKADFMSGKASDTMDFKFTAANVGVKPIRAFKGTVRFVDIFGQEIMRSNLEQTSSLKPGDKIKWEGGINYNQFEDTHRKLRDAELKDLKIEWVPSQVIFADGTKIGG